MILQDGAAEALPAPAADIPRPEAPQFTLEFLLHPDDLPALARLPALTVAAPRCPARLLWYDDDAQTLAAASLALMRDGDCWQVERLEPGNHHDWPACTPAPTLSRSNDLAGLSPSIPFGVAPISAFDGLAHAYRAGDATVTVLHGSVRGVVQTRPVCRLTLTGPAASLTDLLPALTGLRLSIPHASLAREAIAAARDAPLPARHLGAPAIGAGTSIADSLTAIISHLLDVLLYWTAAFQARRNPEAIHQARVATRRLRSALSIYRSAAPALDDAAGAVKHCAATLGAARDWDVFLAGTGANLAATTGGDPRIALLLRAAARRRGAVYTELSDYLDGAHFRHLTLSLGAAAVLRPWNTDEPEDATHAFATAVLTRRLKHIRRRGREIETLPIETLHELRKDCKRLRYAAEFFAPAFPAKRTRPFLRRLSALQEELGILNDTAASAHLMAQLGRAGRGYAGGMVDGIAAASSLSVRAGIVKSWKRFKQADPFWT